MSEGGRAGAGERLRGGTVTIVEHRPVSPGHFFVRVRPDSTRRPGRPGQFFMVSVAALGGTDPLLRRPLSLHRVFPDGDFSMVYRVVGRGTALLSSKTVGESLDVLGPLGNGFPFPPDNTDVLVIGGGIGIVPLVALVEQLRQRDPVRRISVLLGARSGDHLVCVDDFRSLGAEPEIVTDDGSAGRPALVTTLFEEACAAAGPQGRLFVYGCGPKPMLMALSESMKRYRVPGAFSLEERMACGLGACLGCVVETGGGRRRVCLEGPVFPAGDIVWGLGRS